VQFVFFQGCQIDERVLLLAACHLLNVFSYYVMCLLNVFVANKVLSLSACCGKYYGRNINPCSLGICIKLVIIWQMGLMSMPW